MRTRFLHLADIHLGFEQYNLPQRADDFYLTFCRAIDDALQQQVQFVIIAGDLFHHRAINPQTLCRAEHELERLRAAGIPVVGVTGNHERAHYRSRDSWLDYLAARGLFNLLSPRYDAEKHLIVGPVKAGGRGGYLDIGDVRLYGVPFPGAVAPQVVGDLAAYLAQQPPAARFTILILHAGLEGILPQFAANLTTTDLAALRPHIHYLALGHIHKPFALNDWIYNPGSLEPVNIAETSYRGGGYLIEIDPASGQIFSAQHRAYWKRPFVRLSHSVTGYASPEQLYAGFENYVLGQTGTFDEQPLVECTLHGTLQFNRSDLASARIETTLREAFNALHARVNISATPAQYEVASDAADLSRPELERRVLADLIRHDGRYRERADQWAKLVLETKRLALEKADPALIIEQLRAGRAHIVAVEGQNADHAH